MSMIWSFPSNPVILTASSKVSRQYGHATARMSAPASAASLTRVSARRSPGMSTHILPPPPSQHTLLALLRSNSRSLTPGTFSMIFLGSSYMLFCLPKKHGSW